MSNVVDLRRARVMKELGLRWDHLARRGGESVQDPTRALEEVMRQMAGKGKRSGVKGKLRVKTAKAEPRKCECGCGKLTKGGRFLPGHDSRLHSRLLKAAREGSVSAQAEAKAELKKRGW